MKPEKPAGRAGTKSRRDSGEPAAPPQRLNLGCGTLIAAVGVIALLGKFLPHEPRRFSAAASASPPATKTAGKPAAKTKPSKEEPRRTAAVTARPSGSPRQPPAPEPPRPSGAKVPDKPAPRASAVVSNDPWTGSVLQVERYLKRNLYDAASFEALEWGPVAETGQGYRVRCTYRAKNVLGVYATQTRTFLLNRKGEVYAVKDKD